VTDHENQERHEAYDNDEKHGEQPNGFVRKQAKRWLRRHI